jgi:hypothetical protein
MKRTAWLDTAVVVGGIASVSSVIGIYLATHDIFHDYASPALWMRAGATLPEWYSPFSATPLEWGMVQVGIVMIFGFHAALFVRLVTRLRSGHLGTPTATSITAVMGGLSFLGLLGFAIAAYGVHQNYASAEVWARAGQPLPAWYSPGTQTTGQWNAMLAGFLLILAFHARLAWRSVRQLSRA